MNMQFRKDLPAETRGRGLDVCMVPSHVRLESISVLELVVTTPDRLC